jgi:cell wall-associated NlpC family hydrolase
VQARVYVICGRVFWAVALVGATSACASSRAVPRPFPLPSPPASKTAPALQPDVSELLQTALALRGAPYRNGGVDPGGFDCSGFTLYVFAQQGIQLPRDVREQFALGRAVAAQDVEPGDLLFFTTIAPGASHVGIALGAGEFIHAPSSTGVVRVEHVAATYWAMRFVGARRLLQSRCGLDQMKGPSSCSWVSATPP